MESNSEKPINEESNLCKFCPNCLRWLDFVKATDPAMCYCPVCGFDMRIVDNFQPPRDGVEGLRDSFDLIMKFINGLESPDQAEYREEITRFVNMAICLAGFYIHCPLVARQEFKRINDIFYEQVVNQIKLANAKRN
jgi:hypothetical protein